MCNVGHVLLKILLLMSLTFALTACTKITEDNFSKIQAGMSMQQVIAILGEPTKSKSIDFAGLSLTSAEWKNQNAKIEIQFLNDHAQIKSFSKPEVNQTQINTSGFKLPTIIPPSPAGNPQ